jgi:hypothetical protein
MITLGTALFSAGTASWGWWTVPLIAAVLALLRARPWHASVAAVAAWSLLLGRDAAASPLMPYADRLGGLFGLPGVVLVLLTVLFAGLLAWSAATVVDSLRNGGS